MGYGFLTGRIQSDLDPEVEDHFKKLKFGNLYEIDLGYEVNSVWGFGLFFSNLHSDARSSFDGGFFEESLMGENVGVDSDIELNYVAPKLYFFLSEEYNKHQLVSNFSIGYLRYENTSFYNNTSRVLSANTVGLGASLDYEFKITPFVYLNSRFTALVSFVSEFDLEDVEGKRTVSVNNFTNGERERENLSYIGLTVGVRVDIDAPKKKGEEEEVVKKLSGASNKEIRRLRKLRNQELDEVKRKRGEEIKKIRKSKSN